MLTKICNKPLICRKLIVREKSGNTENRPFEKFYIFLKYVDRYTNAKPINIINYFFGHCVYKNFQYHLNLELNNREIFNFHYQLSKNSLEISIIYMLQFFESL